MPGTPEQPVTLGDLRVVESEEIQTPAGKWQTRLRFRPATVADLVLALRAEGAEQRIENVIDAWAPDLNSYAVERFTVELLDALAEAQPLPPAGGVS